MESNERNAEFAVNLLKEYADNLVAALFVMQEAANYYSESDDDEDDTEEARPPVGPAPVLRMTLSWLVVSLYKVKELWGYFAPMASDGMKRRMGAVVKEIDNRGVVAFRNKTVAHLSDDDIKSPMEPEEVQRRGVEMMRNDPLAFALWLHDPSNSRGDTVTAIMLDFRAELLVRYPNVRIYN